MVAADGIVIHEDLKSFREALIMMFSMYFVLNMKYPAEACATLDFLQRLVVEDNLLWSPGVLSPLSY